MEREYFKLNKTITCINRHQTLMDKSSERKYNIVSYDKTLSGSLYFWRYIIMGFD